MKVHESSGVDVTYISVQWYQENARDLLQFIITITYFSLASEDDRVGKDASDTRCGRSKTNALSALSVCVANMLV